LALLTALLGCPAFVPGFPLCGHGRSMNIGATEAVACSSFRSNDPTAKAATVRAFEYLMPKKFVLSSNNCRSIRAFE
jgi:hypothetical protein